VPSNQRTFERLRAQSRQAREIGDYRQAARLERQAAEWAKGQGLTRLQARALLWEGYSLRQTGDDDLALASLLQAANDRAAADPADVFSALTAILHISLERKPFHFCRTLLDQTRNWLFELRRPWSAPLDFLEGELAGRRGEFVTAWDWHSRAWSSWRDEHPRLTPATHLWALCCTAFRRFDRTALEQWTEKLANLCSTQPLEQQLIQRTQLLVWRMKRAEPAPIDKAFDLLASSADPGRRDFGAYREALRVLALVGRWQTVNETLSQRPLKADHFEDQLLLSDLAFNRLRIALDLPTADDDSSDSLEPIVSTAKPIAGQASLMMLDQAKQCYQAAQRLAGEQDERLETHWHSDVVHERQNRLESLAARQ